MARDRARVTPMRGAPLGRTARERANAGSRIRVLLVDRHQLLAQALTVILGADPDLEVVGCLSEPERAPAHVRRTSPDVVLLSYALLHANGIELTTALRAESPQLRIVILTATLDDGTLFTCAQSGAAGCVPSESPPEELIRAIKRVHAGEVLFAPDVLIRLLAGSRNRDPAPELRPATQPLGPRELEVLRSLAAGLSTDEVADRLGITANTVRTHLKNAMAKLEARSKLEAVINALKLGLIELPK